MDDTAPAPGAPRDLPTGEEALRPPFFAPSGGDLAATIRALPSSEPAPGLRGPALAILVVDDDAVFREELADMLREDAHRVVTCPSAASALAAVDAGPFDLVFTDLRMPGTDGLALVAELRRRGCRVPTVLLTGHATPEATARARELGVAGCLSKPFRPEQLGAAIGQAISAGPAGPSVDAP